MGGPAEFKQQDRCRLENKDEQQDAESKNDLWVTLSVL
jgi:hypothetical protein